MVQGLPSAPGQATLAAGPAVYQAIEAAGIEIPFPQRDVHLKKGGLAAAAGGQENSLPAG